MQKEEKELLIVLGKNLGVGYNPKIIRNRRDYLSIESKISALATGIIYKDNMDVILSGGFTSGKDVPSEAMAMKNYIIDRFPNIPRSVLIEENISIDTAGNAEEVAKIIRNRKYEKISLMTVGYHLDNSVLIFKDMGYMLINNMYLKTKLW